VVGAGAGHQDPARGNHLQCPAVDGQVALLSFRQMLAALDEGRRVRDHRAETTTAVVTEEIEDIGGDKRQRSARPFSRALASA